MARDFTAKDATRDNVPLLLGLSGPPGGGKTYSGLLLARGIQKHRGGDIVVIDTEADRARKYAPRPGEAADDVNSFAFKHVPFPPPYRSSDFLEAIEAQMKLNPACIMVDSMSDEHEGKGGMLDWHEREIDRMAGDQKDNYKRRDALSQAGWIKPKESRRELLGGLQRIKIPLIFCFRAREKTKPIMQKGSDGRERAVPTNVGWSPIAPPELVHLMDLFALLPLRADGVPMWKGNTAYEDFAIKLPQAFRAIIPEGAAINSDMGYALSEWAAGGKPRDAAQAEAKPEAPTQPRRQRSPRETLDLYLKGLKPRSEGGRVSSLDDLEAYQTSKNALDFMEQIRKNEPEDRKSVV